MRVLKLAIVLVLVMVSALFLVTNLQPQAEFATSVEGYGVTDLERLTRDLRVEQLRLSTDPFGLGEDLLPTYAFPVPVLLFVLLAIGLIIGVLLAHIAARGVRRELREKRDEVLLLKAELHKAQGLLKAADHPASVMPVARRR